MSTIGHPADAWRTVGGGGGGTGPEPKKGCMYPYWPKSMSPSKFDFPPRKLNLGEEGSKGRGGDHSPVVVSGVWNTMSYAPSALWCRGAPCPAERAKAHRVDLHFLGRVHHLVILCQNRVQSDDPTIGQTELHLKGVFALGMGCERQNGGEGGAQHWGKTSIPWALSHDLRVCLFEMGTFSAFGAWKPIAKRVNALANG